MFHFFSGFNTLAHHHTSVDKFEKCWMKQYPHRWIGRGGPRHWPAWSPELNHLGFFLWSHIKNIVYRNPIATEEQLRGRVQETFATITSEMVTNSKLLSFAMGTVMLAKNGGHFDHLLSLYLFFVS
jgi:hypothetical protein